MDKTTKTNTNNLIGAVVYNVIGDVVVYKKTTPNGDDYIFRDYKNGKEVSIYFKLPYTDEFREKCFAKALGVLNNTKHEQG